MKGLFLIACLAAANLAHAGWDNGNAGDAYVSEFILTGRDVVQRLELLSGQGGPVIDTKALKSTLAATEVVSEDHVFLNNEERDAVNYPDKHLIKMSRTRWNQLRRSTETVSRLRVVLHEYLWVSGVDDTNFQQSAHLIDLLNAANYSPNIWWNPINPVNYVRPVLTFSPQGCAFEQAKFSVRLADETLDLESKGDCGDSYRRVHIIKSTGVLPASSGVRGQFQQYAVTVYNKASVQVGELLFEPEWGECLLPENGSCRVSGKLTIGGVGLSFWFLRD